MVRSRKRLPSTSQTCAPLPRARYLGATPRTCWPGPFARVCVPAGMRPAARAQRRFDSSMIGSGLSAISGLRGGAQPCGGALGDVARGEALVLEDVGEERRPEPALGERHAADAG